MSAKAIQLVISKKCFNINCVSWILGFIFLLLAPSQSHTASPSVPRPNTSTGGCPSFSIPNSLLADGFELGGEKVPITRPDVKARIEFQVNFLLFDARSVLGEWLKEKRKYSWIFEEIFSKEGIPQDFTWLAPVLAGTIRSLNFHRSAGVWALDRPCSSSEGMEMYDDTWRDDRLDIHLATTCFAHRIKNLKQELAAGWLMSSVAYALSLKTTKDLMEKWNSSSVWDIPLPNSVEDMLGRWAALKIIGMNKSLYGLKYADPVPLTYDNITSIELTKDLSIGDVAKFVKVSPRLILELNPKIKPNSGIFPAKVNGHPLIHSIAVPSGSGRVLLQKLQESGYLAPTNHK
ncbi:MAG: hypothetical protein ACLQT6_09955 [Desulfomonilaceae bacterium]